MPHTSTIKYLKSKKQEILSTSFSYVLPLVDKSVAKMIMTKQEAMVFINDSHVLEIFQAELPLLEGRMQQTTNESQDFIEDQLEEAKSITVNQMMETRKAFLTAFSITAS